MGAGAVKAKAQARTGRGRRARGLAEDGLPLVLALESGASHASSAGGADDLAAPANGSRAWI